MKEKHFPFSSWDLRFDIAGGDPDSMPNEHWTISGQCQISNLNWKMENGTLRQFPDLLIVPRIEDRGSINRAYGDSRSSILE